MSVNKRLFIKTHLGMGDNIVHNGMIREFCELYPDYQIYTAAKENNFKNVVFMYRDNPKITVVNVSDDTHMEIYISQQRFDKVITSHNVDRNPYSYDKFKDDAFYLRVQMNPKIKTEKFHFVRDPISEENTFQKLVIDKNYSEYIFLHEKEMVKINRDRLNSSLPIVVADPNYGIFELLKVIENATSVHIISSSFLSLFMCKKYNPNTFAHMYADRGFLAQYVKNHNIDVII